MIRVLIVDDHAVVRRGLAQLLATTDDLSLAGIRAVVAGRSPLDPKAARAARPVLALSDREREVLQLVGQGLPKQVDRAAAQDHRRTVKAHLTSIYHQLGVSDRTQAALWVRRHHGPEVPGG
jgi:DNA-binding NarL/FixJ family response regulator